MGNNAIIPQSAGGDQPWRWLQVWRESRPFKPFRVFQALEMPLSLLVIPAKAGIQCLRLSVAVSSNASTVLFGLGSKVAGFLPSQK
jgi:hypothetical protein